MKYLKYFESNDIDIVGIAKDILIDIDDIDDNISYEMTTKDEYKPGSIILTIKYSSEENLYSKKLNEVADKVTLIIDRLINVVNEYGLELGYWRDVSEFSGGGYESTHPSEWVSTVPLYQGHRPKTLKNYVKKYIIYEKD